MWNYRETRKVRKPTRIGRDNRAVGCHRRGGDYEVVRAAGLASDPNAREQRCVNAGDPGVVGQHRDGGDDIIDICAARVTVPAIGEFDSE